MGKLPPDEYVRFEEHLVACPDCLDQLELTDVFRRALKRVVAEDAARSPLPGRAEPFAWLASLSAWQRTVLTGCAVLLLLLTPTTFFLVRTKGVRHEVAQLKNVSDDWQNKYAAERQSRAALEKQLQDLQERASGKSSLPTDSQSVAPLFALNVTRGEEVGRSEPANRINIPRTAPWIVLSLEYEGEPAFRAYQARLEGSDGRVLWSAEHIPAQNSDALAITLPSRLLPKGKYLLTLEGLGPAGRYAVVSRYSLLVTNNQ